MAVAIVQVILYITRPALVVSVAYLKYKYA